MLDANIMSRDRFNFSERGSLTGLPQTQVPSDPVVEIADAQKQTTTECSTQDPSINEPKANQKHLAAPLPQVPFSAAYGQSSTKGAFQGQAFLLGGIIAFLPTSPTVLSTRGAHCGCQS